MEQGVSILELPMLSSLIAAAGQSVCEDTSNHYPHIQLAVWTIPDSPSCVQVSHGHTFRIPQD
jgi:hypothetical protein